MATLLPFAANGKTNVELLTINYATVPAPSNKIHTFPKGSFFASNTYGLVKATGRILRPDIDYKILQIEGVAPSTIPSMVRAYQGIHSANVILILATGLGVVEWTVDYVGGEEASTVAAYATALTAQINLATSNGTLDKLYSPHQAYAGYVSHDNTQKLEPRLYSFDKLGKLPEDERDYAETHLALGSMTDTIVAGDALVKQAYADWLHHNENLIGDKRQAVVDLVNTSILKWKGDTISVGQFFFSDDVFNSVARKELRLKRHVGISLQAEGSKVVGSLDRLKEGNDFLLRMSDLYQRVSDGDSVVFETFEVTLNKSNYIQGMDTVLATFKRTTATGGAKTFTLQLYSLREGVLSSTSRSMNLNSTASISFQIPDTVRDYPEDTFVARIIEVPGIEKRATVLITNRSFGYSFEVEGTTVAGRTLKQPRVKIDRMLGVIIETLYVHISGDVQTAYRNLVYPILLPVGSLSKSLTIDLLPENMIVNGTKITVKVSKSQLRTDLASVVFEKVLYIDGMILSDDVTLSFNANANGSGPSLVSADEGKSIYLIATYPYNVKTNALRQQLNWSGQMILNTDFAVEVPVAITNEKLSYKVNIVSDLRAPTGLDRLLKVNTKPSNEISIQVKDTTYSLTGTFSYVAGLTGPAYTTNLTSAADNAIIYLKGLIPQALEGMIVKLSLAPNSPMAGKISFPSEVAVVGGKITPLISLVGDYRINGVAQLNMIATIGSNVFNIPSLTILDVSIPTYSVSFLDKNLNPVTTINEGDTFKIMVKGYGDPAFSNMLATITTSYTNSRIVNDVITETGGTSLLASPTVNHGKLNEVKVNTGNWLSAVNDGVTDGNATLSVNIVFPTVGGVKQGRDVTANLVISDTSKTPVYTGEFVNPANQPIVDTSAGAIVNFRVKPNLGQVTTNIQDVEMSIVGNGSAQATISSTTYDASSKQAFAVISVPTQNVPAGLELKVAVKAKLPNNALQDLGTYALPVILPEVNYVGVFTDNVQQHPINPQAVYPNMLDGLVERGSYVYNVATKGYPDGTLLTLKFSCPHGTFSFNGSVVNRLCSFNVNLVTLPGAAITFPEVMMEYLHPALGGKMSVIVTDGNINYPHPDVYIRSKGHNSTFYSWDWYQPGRTFGLVLIANGLTGKWLAHFIGGAQGGGGGTPDNTNANPGGTKTPAQDGGALHVSWWTPTQSLAPFLILDGGKGGDSVQVPAMCKYRPEGAVNFLNHPTSAQPVLKYILTPTIGSLSIPIHISLGAVNGGIGTLNTAGTNPTLDQLVNGGAPAAGGIGGGAGASGDITFQEVAETWAVIPEGKFLAPIPLVINAVGQTGVGGINSKANPPLVGRTTTNGVRISFRLPRT